MYGRWGGVNMLEKGIQELFVALGFFFLHPLFWGSALVAVALGYFRVKRERRHFRVRLLPGVTEWKRLWSESWWLGLLLSFLLLAVGVTVELDWLFVYSAISFLLLLTFYFQWMSPIYAMSLAFFGLLFVQQVNPQASIGGWTLTTTDWLGPMAVTVPLIAGAFLVVEGILVGRSAQDYASPYRLRTKRGLDASAFKVKRMWMLPVIFLVPGEVIDSFLPYWPQFTLGHTSFGLMPLPVVIGFSQMARADFPDRLFPKMATSLVWVGFLVIFTALGGIWMPILGWAALAIGVVGRLLITSMTALRQRASAIVVTPQPSGVVIAGILPNSPGEKMGLLPGECIRTVNGIHVTTEKELYDAIQVNAAHCRLQVIDRDGEVRLMQQVIYRHDHHRLGLLVIR